MIESGANLAPYLPCGMINFGVIATAMPPVETTDIYVNSA